VADEYRRTVPRLDVVKHHRRLTPLGGTRATGGHKGHGLAAVVEILRLDATSRG